MRKILVLAIACALLASAAPATADGASRTAAAAAAKKLRLRAFNSCSTMLSYARRNGLRAWSGGSTGWNPPPSARPMPMATGDAGRPTAPAPAAAEGAGSGSDFSTTNVQEEGVDEPDIAKTDGRTLFSLASGQLHAVDIRATAPKLLGSLRFPESYPQDMLLHGKRLLVFSGGGGTLEPQPMPVASPASSSPAYYGGITVITEVDVSDPTAMRVLRVERIEGHYVSARLNGDTARVVIVSQPVIELPAGEPPPESPEEYQAQQRRAIRRTRTTAWRPDSLLQTRTKTRRRPAVTCRSVRRSPVFAGLDMLTILTIDMGKGLPAVDSDALMTSADVVYGSPKNLYLATQRWLPASVDTPAELPKGPITTIHRFDVSDPDKTSYRSSGAVPGFLLSQWSLSEHEGRLRVASTLLPTWWGTEQVPTSESFVTVLDEVNSNLVQVGAVGGLGRGERIYAVRFIGDVGYVVTFRQVDPLYTIDLSNPNLPRVRGELKILGYSAYLHPIGDDLLLGIGQDATEEGRRQGSQLSVFDVSDLDNPTRLHQRNLGTYSSSEAEYEHHAFLWWAPEKLAVVPVQVYSEQGPQFIGAIGFRIDKAAGITEVGRVTHKGDQEWASPVRRSMVAGSRLFTQSDLGLMSNALATFDDAQWLAFPRPEPPSQ